jgi:hypothetical protein
MALNCSRTRACHAAAWAARLAESLPCRAPLPHPVPPHPTLPRDRARTFFLKYCSEQSNMEKVRPQLAKLPPSLGASRRKLCARGAVWVGGEAIGGAGGAGGRVRERREVGRLGCLELLTHLQGALGAEARRRVLHPAQQVPRPPAHGAHGEGSADVVEDPVWARLALVLHHWLLPRRLRHCCCAALIRLSDRPGRRALP